MVFKLCRGHDNSCQLGREGFPLLIKDHALPFCTLKKKYLMPSLSDTLNKVAVTVQYKVYVHQLANLVTSW